MRFVVLLLLALLTACQSGVPLAPGPTPTEVPCYVQAAPFVVEAREVAARLGDLIDVGGSTSRMALAPIVQDFQELRREAEELEAPECAADTKLFLVEAIREATDGFLAFMADEPERVVNKHFESAGTMMQTVGRQLRNLEPPDPTPTP